MIGYVICGLFFVTIGFVAGWSCDWFFGDGKDSDDELNESDPKFVALVDKICENGHKTFDSGLFISGDGCFDAARLISDEQIQKDYEENLNKIKEMQDNDKD